MRCAFFPPALFEKGKYWFWWGSAVQSSRGTQVLLVHAHPVPAAACPSLPGEGREGSLTFAAGSRCCRSTAGPAGFRWNLPLHNTSIFFPPVTVSECKLGWIISICFPFSPISPYSDLCHLYLRAIILDSLQPFSIWMKILWRAQKLGIKCLWW